MFKIGVIHGPNLNQLGKRNKEYYGSITLSDINNMLEKDAQKKNIQLEIIQTNHEGEIIDTIQFFSDKVNGIIINPGAFTHYSYAIRDALEDCTIPIIEVHLSNIFSRDHFRMKSVTAAVCKGQIVGLGYYGYLMALEGISYLLRSEKESGNIKENWDG